MTNLFSFRHWLKAYRRRRKAIAVDRDTFILEPILTPTVGFGDVDGETLDADDVDLGMEEAIDPPDSDTVTDPGDAVEVETPDSEPETETSVDEPEGETDVETEDDSDVEIEDNIDIEDNLINEDISEEDLEELTYIDKVEEENDVSDSETPGEEEVEDTATELSEETEPQTGEETIEDSTGEADSEPKTSEDGVESSEETIASETDSDPKSNDTPNDTDAANSAEDTESDSVETIADSDPQKEAIAPNETVSEPERTTVENDTSEDVEVPVADEDKGSDLETVPETENADATVSEGKAIANAEAKTESDKAMAEETSESESDETADTTQSSFDLTSGTFTVGETGQVSFDFLFDGGAYKNELSVFSLEGLEDLEPGSEAFLQEVFSRVTSHSQQDDFQQGFVAISDASEGARFDGKLGESRNWNSGAYSGVKTFSMRPGDTFGLMLIPNGTASQIANNLDNLQGAKLPLFSIPSANPGGHVHISQLADVTGDGSTFAMEDIRYDLNPDLDYNDIIFQIRGAFGRAPHISEVISEGKDWTGSDLGQAIDKYSEPYIQEVEEIEIAETDPNSGEQGEDISTTKNADQTVPSNTPTKKVTVEENNNQSKVEQQHTKVSTGQSDRGDGSSSESFTETTFFEEKSDSDSDMSQSGDRSQESPQGSDVEASEGSEVEKSNTSDSPAVTIDGVESSDRSGSEASNSSTFEDITLPSIEIEEAKDSNSEGTASVQPASSDGTVKETSIEGFTSLPKLEPFEFPAENQPLIGAIDTGFAANHPDIDYSNILLGRDRIDGDDNPLLTSGEGNEHGTHILGIIKATQNNDIGIEGINDDAPIWLGRSQENWAESLIEFVDAAKEANQPNAIVNLSFSLTQTDAQGNVTTRSELNFLERSAIEYARQNGIAIVVAAGNDANVLSALGQASQEFDNIITVGAAENTKPEMAPDRGFDRADYSNHGRGLDILAEGGTIDNPVISTVGDGLGTMAGTSVAAAKVTGSLSVVWAANPELSYRQVIDVIKSTATDLKVPNWDSNTGAGLLNLAAAIHLAKATEPKAYTPPPINVFNLTGTSDTPYVVGKDETPRSIAHQELGDGDLWTDIKTEDGDGFSDPDRPLDKGQIVYLPVVYEPPTETGTPLVDPPSSEPIAIAPPNEAPEAVDASIDGTFHTSDVPVGITGEAVDPDGAEDLAKVEFWVRQEGEEEWVKVGETDQFTLDGSQDNGALFDYDLTGLRPGIYEIKAIAVDKQGATSQETLLDKIEVLSDAVSGAIAAAANLDSYKPEALAATRKWTIGIANGFSLEELAAQIGVANLKPTGFGTYSFDLPEGVDLYAFAEKLRQIQGIEFSYPLVPVKLHRLQPPTDWALHEYQWHLKEGISGGDGTLDAWNIPITNESNPNPVRGRGVTIAIVDDGIAYDHLELNPGYRENLSWDFNNSDNDPHFTSTTTLQGKTLGQAMMPNDIPDEIVFELPSYLTGIVSNISASLEFDSSLSEDLISQLSDGIFLRSPNDSLFHQPDDRGRSSRSSYYPGYQPPTTVIKRKLKELDEFEGYYAGGTWKLIVENPSSYGKLLLTPEELQELSQTLLKSWSLTFETVNPHGTAVAGIAAAAENDLYGVGVAPEVSIAGIRLIGDTNPLNYLEDPNGKIIADTLTHKYQQIDIFNNSWGPEFMTRQPGVITALEDGVDNGRNNLGNLYVFSAGNEGDFDGSDVNENYLANSRHTIAVGAVTRFQNEDGAYFAPYSTPGASVFISAYSSDSLSASSDSVITTLDANDFNKFYHFGGTSASAPFVSGVIALMLEANPNLTVRDVQHILAETADRPQEEHKDWTGNPGDRVRHHYRYGFGAVNPKKAVEKAKNWEPVQEEYSVSSGEDFGDTNSLNFVNLGNGENSVPIPNNNSEGIDRTINIDEDMTVEWAEVIVDIEHDYRGDLEIVLVGPDGTESILARERDFDPGKDYTQWTFTSLRHWGQSSKGDWTLKVRDRNDETSTTEGTLNSWKLNLYGTQPKVTVETNKTAISEAGEAVEVTLKRTGNTQHDLAVNYTIAGENIDVNDYQIFDSQGNAIDPNAVTIPTGESEVKLTIVPLDDDDYEGTEGLEFRVVPDDSYTTDGASQTVVEIVDNDRPKVTIALNDAIATEWKPGESPDWGEITVSRTGITSEALTIDYNLGGTAVNGSDYVNLDGTITIPVGKSSITLPILPIDDTVDELDETVTFEFAESSKYDWIGDRTAQVSIVDNDPATVSIEAIDSVATEDGNAATFAITREGLADEPLTVKVAVAGDAKNGTDYVQLTETVTIPAGENTVTLPVVPLFDYDAEGDETVQISIVADEDYYVGDASASATISNSDTTSRYGSFVYENPETGHLYILSDPDTWPGAQGQAEALGGNLVTINDQAEQDWLLDTFGTTESLWIGYTDSKFYNAEEGSFQWVSGESADYTNWHPNEPNNLTNFGNNGASFAHLKRGSTNGLWNDVPNNPSVLIPGIIEIDPATLDKPIVNIMVTDAEAGEDGNAAQIVVTRIGNLDEDLTVNYNLTGDAVNGSDYQELPGTVTIPAGESLVTIPILVNEDGETEGDETLTLSLATAAGYSIGTHGKGQVTIAEGETKAQTIYTHPETGNKYILTVPDTWLGAQEQAILLGGNLVTIDSEAENQWLADTFPLQRYWIGLNDSPTYGNSEGNFQWVSGDPVSYTSLRGTDNVLYTPEGEDFFEFNFLREPGAWNDIIPDLTPNLGFPNPSGIVEITNDIPSINIDPIPQFTKLENSFGSATDTTIDRDGNIIVVGETWTDFAGTREGLSDTVVVKYDSDGNLLWKYQLGDESRDWTRGVDVDADGNIYVVGSRGDDSQQDRNSAIAKLSPDGQLLWEKAIETTFNNWTQEVVVSGDGSFYITGITGNSLADGSVTSAGDAFVAHYDEDGNLLWSGEWGTPGNDTGTGIAVDSDGSIYVAGTANATYTNEGGDFVSDAFIAKYNNNGTLAWSQEFGTASKDWISDIKVDADDNLYVVGQTDGDLAGENAGDRDLFIAKYDKNGNELWTKQLGTADKDGSGFAEEELAIDENGNLYVVTETTGSLGGENAGGRDAVILRLDAEGNVTWKEQVGSTKNEAFKGVATDGNGNLVVAGFTSGTIDGETANMVDFLVKTYRLDTQTYTEDTPLELTGIAIADTDSDTVTATLTLSDLNAGILTGGDFDPATGTLTISGSVAVVNAALAAVQFVPAENYNSDVTISTTVTDGNIENPIVGQTIILKGEAVNDAPTLNTVKTFFGEDVNPNGRHSPLVNTPNTDAAYSDFVAKLDSISVEDLESFAHGDEPDTFTFGSQTATLSGGTVGIHDFSTGKYHNEGTYPHSGDKYLFQWGEDAESFTINFDTPQSAFGFSTTDIGDVGGELILTLHREDGSSEEITVPNQAGSGGSSFFGAIDEENPFVAVTLTNTNAAVDMFAYDNFIIGDVKPTANFPEAATQHQPQTVTYAELLAASDAKDVDGDAISFVIDSIDRGTVTVNGNAVVPGVTTVSKGDKLTWIPNEAGDSIPAFSVKASDGNLVSDTAVAVTMAVASRQDIQVNTYIESTQSQPSIAPLKDGGYIVTWHSIYQDGGSYGVYSQRFDANSQPVGEETQVNTTTNSAQWSPVVTTLDDGSYVIAWESYNQDGSSYGIIGQRFNAEGKPVSEEFVVNTYTNSNQRKPAITALDNGNFVVVWHSLNQDGSSNGVYGQVFDSNGNKVGDEFRANNHTDGYQAEPAVTPVSDGFVVTWHSENQDGSEDGIFARKFDNTGNAIASEFPVNSHTDESQSYPSVATFPDGSYIITWQSEDRDGSSYGIYGQRFDADNNPLGDEFRINTTATSHQINSAVTTLSDGSFVVTWQSYEQDGSLYGIFAQQFDNNGNSVGEEFQVNTSSHSHQGLPVITTLTDGRYAIAWKSDSGSYSGDGSGRGVFVQTFSSNISEATDTENAIPELSKINLTPANYQHSGSTDPKTESWQQGFFEGNTVGAVNDNGIEAWITGDNSSELGSGANYKQYPTTVQNVLATENGWKLKANFKIVSADDDLKGSVMLLYRNTLNGYQLHFGSDSDGNTLVLWLTNEETFTHTLTGVSAEEYHDYELVFDPETDTAKLLVDGEEKLSGYPGYDASGLRSESADDSIVLWGSGSSSGQGSAYWQSVEFETLKPQPTAYKPYSISYAELLAASDAKDGDGDDIDFLIDSIGSGTVTVNGVPVEAGVTTLSPGDELVWIPDTAGDAIPAFSVKATDGEATSNAVEVKLDVAGNPATFIAPDTPYLSFDDSPFKDVEFDYFHLEDFEDGSLNVPGVTASAGTVTSGITTDSVDGDDGNIDGEGSLGHSWLSLTPNNTIEFTFDKDVLGDLPTHAGVVWTDVGFSTHSLGNGYGSVQLEAFDADGNSLGIIGPKEVGDGTGAPSVSDDRFLGVTHDKGISKIAVTMPDSQNWELDHLQFGHEAIPNNSWIRQLGTADTDSFRDVTVDNEGNVFSVGSTNGTIADTGLGGYDAFVSKHDADGNLLWTQQLPIGNGNETGSGVATDSEGNVYVTAWSQAGPYHFYSLLYKYDRDGNFVWWRGLPTSNVPWDVKVDGNDDVYVVGDGNLPGETPVGLTEAWILKYDSEGNTLWQDQIATPAEDRAMSLAIDDNNNVYLGGVISGSIDGEPYAGSLDGFVAKYTPEGNREWLSQLGTDGVDRVRGMTVDGDGNVIIAGMTDKNLAGDNQGGMDGFVAKFDANGQLIWSEQIGSSSNDAAFGVVVDSDNNIYVQGTTDGNLHGETNSGQTDVFVAKFDPNGNRIATELLGTAQHDGSPGGIAIDRSDNLYLAGDTLGVLEGENAGSNDAWVAKNAIDFDSDPLFTQQWHLENTENNTGGNVGIDINLDKVWEEFTGKGVTIAIVDDGLQHTHPDIQPNYDPNLSIDINEGDSDPSPFTFDRTYTSSGAPIAIEDNFFTFDDGIQVGQRGAITDLKLTFDIDHPNPSELNIYLIDRSQHNDGNVDDLIIEGLSNSGLQTIDTDVYDGEEASGTWNLVVEDTKSGNVGTLNNWSLTFDTANGQGTAVAGIAAGKGGNGIGISGVAPDATLAGIRLLSDDVNESQIGEALFSELNDSIDIFNNSWKPPAFFESEVAKVALEKGATEGRNNLGNIYVFGAGNDALLHENLNLNTFANSRHTIAVGAIDHQGKRTAYSQLGAPLLIVAPSGAAGYGLTTTDLTGSNGLNAGGTQDSLYGTDNADPNYTNTFDGTSAAAPIVSGVVALMLEANPNLTARDVQHILVTTANRDIIAGNADWEGTVGGIQHSYSYGFGVVDAQAAVEAAKNWTPVAPEVEIVAEKIHVFSTIPEGTPLQNTVTIDEDINVEWVEVVFDADHPYPGDVEIELISPSGMKSLLVNTSDLSQAALGSRGAYDNWVLTSARHWGESSQGDWKLVVRDKVSGEVGVWNSWQLRVYGT